MEHVEVHIKKKDTGEKKRELRKFHNVEIESIRIDLFDD